MGIFSPRVPRGELRTGTSIWMDWVSINVDVVVRVIPIIGVRNLIHRIIIKVINPEKVFLTVIRV